MERRLESQKFNAKGDLLAFASRHPGALSGFFLSMCHRKLSHGRVQDSRELRTVSVSGWAQQFAGLTELRDQKEVQHLALCMDLINGRDLEQAMDLLAQRISAVQMAKRKGGSWEKAENIELLAGPRMGSAAGGILKLTA
jgi:hypothetical protein